MSRSRPSTLSTEKEAEARSLALRLRELADEELLEMARLLVGKPEHEIFGDSEFELRDIVLKIGAKALEEHLRQKKTATTDRASTVPPVNRPPSCKAIDANR